MDQLAIDVLLCPSQNSALSIGLCYLVVSDVVVNLKALKSDEVAYCRDFPKRAG